MELKLKRLNPKAVVPSYGTAGAACFDFYAMEDIELKPGAAITVGTGWAVEVPEGHVMLVYSRSGHGFKHSVRLVNSVGVIDADYRGEVAVRLVQDYSKTSTGVTIPAGTGLAQAMILPVPVARFIEVPELSDTKRGKDGFGSTDRDPSTLDLFELPF